MTTWYKIIFKGGVSDVFIGITCQLEVVRWMNRKFPTIVVVEECDICGEYELEELIEIEVGAFVDRDMFILEMAYSHDKCAPRFKYSDELLMEHIVESFIDDVSSVVLTVIVFVEYFRPQICGSNAFSSFTKMFQWLNDEILIAYRDSDQEYRSKLNETLLLINFLETEGVKYYEGY